MKQFPIFGAVALALGGSAYLIAGKNGTKDPMTAVSEQLSAVAEEMEERTVTAFELGQAAMDESDWQTAAEHFRQAIDEERDNYEAHDAYLNASDLAIVFGVDPELDEEARDEAILAAQEEKAERLNSMYAGWAESDPGNPLYRWALGKLQMYKNYDRVEEFMLEAIRLDPGFAPAYQTLALIEDVRGNVEGQAAYLKKSVEAAPDDPNFAFYHAMIYRKIDHETFEREAMAVADRFPEHERGAQALYWLAAETQDTDKKRARFESLVVRYPIEEFNWSASAKSALYGLYAKSDPEEALKIAEEMVKLTESETGQFSMAGLWIENRNHQAVIIEAHRLFEAGDFAAARAILEETTPGRMSPADPYNLAMARALDGAGETRKAFDYLVGITAEKPTDKVNGALTEYAKKLGLTQENVDTLVWAIIEANAKPVEDFSFDRIDSDEKISLSEYRGNVVLLNFWYPFCGPCRGENPELQRILEKYEDDGFAILALNVHPEEEQFVMPYITGMNFGFVPLRSDIEFAEENFQARGMPTNILLDTQGRMVSRLPPVHGDAARTFELQIETLQRQR